jgi:hypothetical protein
LLRAGWTPRTLLGHEPSKWHDRAELVRPESSRQVAALLIGRRALVALGIPVLTADYDFWLQS